MIENMVNHLPAGFDPKIVFELGVFDGKQTIELSKQFPAARIYSFDCSPRCAVDIRKVVNGLPNVKFTEVAVGDRDYDTVFKQCKSDAWGPRGSGSLLKLNPEMNWDDQWTQHDIPVHVTRLDTWAAANGVTGVDLIWSDLQGCDYEALVGLGTLLDTTRAVYAEVMYQPIYTGQRLFPDLDAYMTLRGFKLKGNWPLPPPHVFGDALWLRV